MDIRKIMWGLGAALTFTIFYSLIPTRIYNSYPFIISMIGAAIFTILLVQMIFDFRSFEDLNAPEEGEKADQRLKLLPFMVIPGIVMMIVFYMHFSTREENELKEFGVITQARIVNGSSLKLGRGKSFDLVIQFFTPDGKERIVQESVGESEWRSVGKGEVIDIIYSSKNPQLMALLLDESAINTYVKRENRRLRVEDLMAIDGLPDDSISGFLNKVSFKWAQTTTEGGKLLWENNNKNEYVIQQSPGMIQYLFSDFRYFDAFEKASEAAGFQKIVQADSTEQNKIFQGDKHRMVMSTTTAGIQVFFVVTLARMGE
jgi:hypothetical protein